MTARASCRRFHAALRGPVAMGLALAGPLARPAHAGCPSDCGPPTVWSQPFTFAGLTWERKGGCGGPGPNCWTPDHVTPVEAEGVRLRLAPAGGRWLAGEIRTAAPVGHGSYSIRVVGRTDLLDANVVMGIFLYDDEGAEAGDPCPAEIDTESGRFGDPLGANGHGAVFAPAECGAVDLYNFAYTLTGTHTTHQIRWDPGRVTLRWLHGHRCEPDEPGQVIAERVFRSPQVPSGRMRLHINVWALAGEGPSDGQDVEVVIRDVLTTCAVAVAAPVLPVTDLELAVRPSPFQGATEIAFAVPEPGHVRVTVLDVAGRRVATLADAELPADRHRVRWAPGELQPGVYFARITYAGRVITRRIVRLE